MTAELGRLEFRALRDAWRNEEQNFTPWLADNLDRLSEAIDISLEAKGTEVRVDRFAADILARNTDDGSTVLIENQLEPSDHKHLGQILTYSAGLKAQTAIWIAKHFEEAHLSAIRWLNENTGDLSFFAVQIKVVQIGDSPLAPFFEVLEKPSTWNRQVRDDPAKELRRAFWQYCAERHPGDEIHSGCGAKRNFPHPVESVKLRISQTLKLKQKEIGILLRGKTGELKAVTLKRAHPYETALRSEVDTEKPGETWVGIDEKNGWVAHKSWSIDVSNPANWDAAADWLNEHLKKYRHILTQSP